MRRLLPLNLCPCLCVRLCHKTRQVFILVHSEIRCRQPSLLLLNPPSLLTFTVEQYMFTLFYFQQQSLHTLHISDLFIWFQGDSLPVREAGTRASAQQCPCLSGRPGPGPQPSRVPASLTLMSRCAICRVYSCISFPWTQKTCHS